MHSIEPKLHIFKAKMNHMKLQARHCSLQIGLPNGVLVSQLKSKLHTRPLQPTLLVLAGCECGKEQVSLLKRPQHHHLHPHPLLLD